jgi:hypothetical protein
MCCFSGPVREVAKTRIFARAGDGGRQLLAYQMKVSAAADLAMILPLPVPKGTPDGAVRFINLEGYPNFFDDLEKGFAPPPSRRVRLLSEDTLPVEGVGSFEASFVPSVKDFARLDARFRMPAGVWDQLPQYQTFGFAVFKLKRGAHTVHPMAFEFPRADASKLFFPTVHVHDGTVRPEARFDHALYCQDEGHLSGADGWRESRQPAGRFSNIERAKGLLDKDGHCYFKRLSGKLKNQDTVV